MFDKSNLTSVSSHVESLSKRVDGIISSLTILRNDSAALEAGLLTTQTELAKIAIALEGVVASEELGLTSNTLADLQTDIREMLENNAVIKTNITLINPASLQVAVSLIDTATDENSVLSRIPTNGTGLGTITLQLDNNFVALATNE